MKQLKPEQNFSALMNQYNHFQLSSSLYLSLQREETEAELSECYE
jgi:hypothetical protein